MKPSYKHPFQRQKAAMNKKMIKDNNLKMRSEKTRIHAERVRRLILPQEPIAPQKTNWITSQIEMMPWCLFGSRKSNTSRLSDYVMNEDEEEERVVKRRELERFLSLQVQALHELLERLEAIFAERDRERQLQDLESAAIGAVRMEGIVTGGPSVYDSC